MRTISHLPHPGQSGHWYGVMQGGAPPSLASYYLPFWCVHNFGGRWAEIKSLSLGLPTYWNLSIMFYITIPSTSQQPAASSQLNIKPNKRGISVVMEGEIVIVSGRNEETAASDTSNNFFRLLLCRSLYHCLQSGICRKCYYVAYCLRDFDRKRCRACQIFIFNVRISLTSEGGSGNLHIYILSIFCGVCCWFVTLVLVWRPCKYWREVVFTLQWYRQPPLAFIPTSSTTRARHRSRSSEQTSRAFISSYSQH